jgi:hypothetical protein
MAGPYIFALALAAMVPAAPEDMKAAPPASCPAVPMPLPPELAGWTAKVSVKAAGSAKAIAVGAIGLGTSAKVALLPTPKVLYPARPEKPGGGASFGGLLGFIIAKAGTYRVALGSPAWVDVASGGKAIASTAHAHGPKCSGIRKLVDFPLTPGRYVLEVSGNEAPAVTLMVTALP